MLCKSYLNLKLKFEIKHFTLIDLSTYISNPQCCEDRHLSNRCYSNDLESFAFLTINFHLPVAICFKIPVLTGFFFSKTTESASFKLTRYNDIFDVRLVIFNLLM